MRIKERTINQDVYATCIERGYPEIVARIIAGRIDTFDKNIFEFTIDAIKSADIMADCTKAAKRIAEAIHSHETILLFTDYDVDGCTSMAIMYQTLHNIFDVPDSRIIKLTGHRTLDGYGLTDPVADKILSLRQGCRENIGVGQSENIYQDSGPSLVVTADAGASDGPRIKRLADAGIDVIVTDHHLIPKDGIPDAAFAVVNPQRDNCKYDPKIAGCGVVWLLMTALSKEMGNTDKSLNTGDTGGSNEIDGSKRMESSTAAGGAGCSIEQKQKIHQLLDHVALGTVADLVPLTSAINRYFVKKGLEFMNRKLRPCWQVALNGRVADTGYLAFQLAPRINASSRMSCEAATALDFLTENSTDKIIETYRQLDRFNTDRQKIEKEMFYAAKASMGITEAVLDITDPSLSATDPALGISTPVIIYYSENNHPGIQGIVAGKLTEHFGVPAVMIADIGGGIVTGSGRAGQFLHIRDSLQTFDDRFPGIFIAYGGHRAAAGFKLHKDNLELFKREFTRIVIEQLEGQDITPYLHTDGSLKNSNTKGTLNSDINPDSLIKFDSQINSNNNIKFNNQINLETYYHIEKLRPFGMGFPAPLFNDQMVATNIKVMGKNPVHLSMMLDGVKAAFFNALDKPGDPLPIHSGDLVDVVYTLNLNSWQGQETLQLIVKKIYGEHSK